MDQQIYKDLEASFEDMTPDKFMALSKMVVDLNARLLAAEKKIVELESCIGQRDTQSSALADTH